MEAGIKWFYDTLLSTVQIIEIQMLLIIHGLNFR